MSSKEKDLPYTNFDDLRLHHNGRFAAYFSGQAGQLIITGKNQEEIAERAIGFIDDFTDNPQIDHRATDAMLEQLKGDAVSRLGNYELAEKLDTYMT